MCRFIAYVGNEILLADLVINPENSLIRQSYKSRERSEPLNGDGFGVGWYTPDLAEDPCVFKSISPAWSNSNLLSIADHVRSGCFFAHVRAASPGMAVSETNCHPFQIGRYLWMHNGSIQGFTRIRRRLCDSLPDDLYDAVKGTTDSEHAFAVFLDVLSNKVDPSPSAVRDALIKTICKLEEWVRESGAAGPSIYNFAVTDGKTLAAVRYVSDPEVEPISLYFSKRGEYRCCRGKAEIGESRFEQSGIIVASERLTENNDDWVRVAPNHVLTVDSCLNAKVDLMAAI
jgi:glutamine amidotransferase